MGIHTQLEKLFNDPYHLYIVSICLLAQHWKLFIVPCLFWVVSLFASLPPSKLYREWLICFHCHKMLHAVVSLQKALFLHSTLFSCGRAVHRISHCSRSQGRNICCHWVFYFFGCVEHCRIFSLNQGLNPPSAGKSHSKPLDHKEILCHSGLLGFLQTETPFT